MRQPSSRSRRGKTISKQAASTTQFRQKPSLVHRPATASGVKGVTGKRAPTRIADRLTDHDVSRNTAGAVHKEPEALTEQPPGLPELVWKYFESEIREALIEVQAALANSDHRQKQSLTKQKQVRK